MTLSEKVIKYLGGYTAEEFYRAGKSYIDDANAGDTVFIAPSAYNNEDCFKGAIPGISL